MAFIITGGYWEDHGYYETYSNPQFDSGARSVAELTADGAFTFTVGQATGIVCGLNSVDLDAGYLEIDHAFYIENGKSRVVENGVFKTTFSNYTTGAVFSIERIGGVVRYRVDGVLKYTSLLPSAGTVFLDCSLYAANDTVILGEVVAYERLEFNLPKPTLYLEESLSLDIALAKPTINILESDGLLIFDIQRPSLYLEEALSLSISVDKPALTIIADETLAVVLPRPELLMWGADVSTLVFDLPKPSIYFAETLIIPDSSILQFTVPKPQLLLNEEENLSLTIEVASLAVVISEVQDFCHVVLSKPSVAMQESIQNFFFMNWPQWVLNASILINEVATTIPAPILTATANDHDNAHSTITLPAPTLAAYTGASTRFTLPEPTLTATATSPGFATAALELPEPLFVATALTGELATVAVAIPAPELTAATGAYASLGVLAPILTATATSITLASAHLTLPLLELTATATSGAVATVTLELPELVFAANGVVGNTGTVSLTIPGLILTANGAGVVTETTYAINLNTGAVTNLLMGEFTKLVTAHGRLYGLRDGALVKLEGDTDDGATIQATIRFAPQTFGTNKAKRMSDVYLSSREDDGVNLTLVQDEINQWQYQTNTDTAPTYGTHKVKVGRGIKFHTAGIILQNRNGGRMDIGGMELLVDGLSPRPKT